MSIVQRASRSSIVAALICAKVFKISDRLDPVELARNPERFKSKDVTDLFRRMVARNGAAVRAVFDQGAATPEIAETIAQARRRLLSLRPREGGNWMTNQIVLQWGADVMTGDQAHRVIDEWFDAFGD